MNDPLVTLTTDFGLRDPYVAEVKAVILKICPNAKIVDVTHQIEKFNTRMGAYILASAAPYFGNGTVHVAIVDPGVGTERRPIIVQTDKYLFVGPDNGVLALAVNSTSCKKHVFVVTNSELTLPRISHTFHGRDVFAPAAAHLANGTPPSEFGPKINSLKSPQFAKIVKRDHTLIGQIIHVDDFGNLITNFTKRELQKQKFREKLSLKVGRTQLVLRICTAYGEVRKLQPLAIIGSNNYLEISVNQGSAASAFKAQAGDEVALKRAI